MEELFKEIHQKDPEKRTFVCIKHFERIAPSLNNAEPLLFEYPNIQLIASMKSSKHALKPSTSLFYEMRVESMDEEMTLKVLEQKYQGMSTHVLKKAVYLTNRYFPHQSNPIKSLELIEECFADHALHSTSSNFDETLIEKVIASKTNIPLSRIQEEKDCNLEKIEQQLTQAVVGQDQVIKIVAEDILCFKGGWNNSQKPPMVYVFAGPTGVGKTELAKKIAEVTFGNAKKLIRLDMAEYHNESARARLIGAPPGYIGFDQGGQLTNEIEKHGSCVVLLDEIEKAHPSVLKFFLSVFDEGRITSAAGKTYDCKNICFVMTTNLGVAQIEHKIQEQGSINSDQIKEIIDVLISSQFGIEWLARVKVLPFSHLTKDVANQVVKIHLEKLAKEFANLRQIEFKWEAQIVSAIVDKGFNPKMGARPLISLIDKKIRLEMAKLEGKEKLLPNDIVDCNLGHEGEIFVMKRLLNLPSSSSLSLDNSTIFDFEEIEFGHFNV